LAIPADAWSPSRSPVCSPTRIKAIPGITDVATDQLNAGPMLDITIKREVASSYGIMPYAIDNTLDDAFGQIIFSTPACFCR
jgi:Cu/Ag efflux pump CusA